MMESYNYSRTARAFNLKQSKVNLQKTIYLPKVSTESDVTTGTLSTLAIYRDKDVFAEVEVAYLEVVKYVYLREDQLKFLEASIRKCSQLYWKLAEALIQEERDFHTPSTEASSAYRKSLIEAQIVLRRDIIACREQTLCLLEAVTSWRSLNATQTRRAIVPTVLYKGENYLVKMLTDVNLLFESGIVRIWLGFQPDCFLLPPSSKDLDPSQYDPLTHWKETYKKKYHEWRRLKAVVNTRRERSEKVSPSKGKLLEAVHQIILPLKPHTMADVVLDALTEIKAQKYGWKAMETLCQNAWDISDSIDGLISSSSSSLYTTTTYCNIMMEAATGFENVFPASLLGAVNAEIYEKRTLYLDLLEAESAALASLLEVREKSSVLKKEMSLCSANSLEKMKNQAVLNGEQQAELLKKRQEQKLSTYGNYSSVDLPSFESESAPYKCTTFITSSIETPKVSDMPPSPSCPLLLQATSRTLTAIRSKVTDLRALVRRKGSYQSSIEPGKLRALRCHRHSIRAESARVVQNELRRYQNILGEQKAVEEKARLLHAVLLVRKLCMRLVYNLRDRKRKIRVKAEALRILNLHRIKQRSARIVTNFIRKAGKLQTVYVDSKPVFSSKRVNALTNKLHYATEELNLGLARLYINTDIIKKESPSKKGPPSSPKGKTSHLKSPLSLTLHASPDHDDFRGGRRYRSLIGEENDGVISPTSPSFIKHNRRGAISPNLIVVEGSPETFPAPVLPAVQIITSNVPSKRIAHFSPPKDSLYRSRLMPPSPHLFSKLPNGAFLIPAAMVNHTAASVGGKDLKKSVYLSPVKPVLKISGTQGKIADKGGDHCGSPPKDPQGINLSLRDCLKDAFRN